MNSCKLGKMEPQGISRAGQTVFARLMESQIHHWLASSVALPTSLFGRKLSPSSCLDARHLSSPCMPLVPFKLLPQCWSSEGVSLSKFMCGFFKWNCLGLQKFLPLTQSLLVFVARSYGDLSSRHWNPGLEGPIVGPLLPRYPS